MSTNGLLQKSLFFGIFNNLLGELNGNSYKTYQNGRTKKPFYRIVVTDSRKKRDGSWIESIGYYNPMVEPKSA